MTDHQTPPTETDQNPPDSAQADDTAQEGEETIYLLTARRGLPEPELLAETIKDAFVNAEHTGGELPDWGARALALSLSTRHDPSTPALEQFARTGEAAFESVNEEAMLIYLQDDTTSEVKLQINYLMTFLLAERRRREAEARLEALFPTPELSDNARAGTAKHGAAFQAFLELPDVDVTLNDLTDTFEDVYKGEFQTMSAVVTRLSEWEDWTVAVGDLAEHLGIPGQIRLDYQAIERRVREVYDIVEYKGMLYAFEK